jgi:ribosome-associated translation inhibitor RaiA
MKHDHLWNDLPYAERERLAPYQMESQINNLRGARVIMVEHHKQMLADLDAWISNIQRELDKASEKRDGEG